MNPTGQTDRLVDMAGAQRAAGVGPVTVHGDPESSKTRENPRVWMAAGLADTARPGNRMRVPAAAVFQAETPLESMRSGRNARRQGPKAALCSRHGIDCDIGGPRPRLRAPVQAPCHHGRYRVLAGDHLLPPALRDPDG